MKFSGLLLVTGQEIFGNIENTPEGRIKVNNPISIRLVPSQIQGGQPGMAMVPFPSMGEHGTPLFIEPLHVVCLFTPVKEMVSEYNQIFQNEKGSPQIITG